jgi:hypothetical protein
VTNNGVVTAIGVGSVTFTFTNTSTGCSSATTAITVNSCANISGSYFETGWDNWVDGGIDAERYTGSNSAEGIWSISLRDNSLVESAMTSPTLSLATYQSVKVEFKFKMVGVETGEDFWLQYSSDGTNWTTIKAWVRGSVYNNGIVYADNAILNVPQWTLTNTAKFRFQADASDDTDLFYIDAVVINGYASPQANSNISVNRQTNSNSITSKELNYTIFPNPANDILHIKLSGELDADDILGVKMYDATGRLVNENNRIEQEEITINVSDLNEGLYFIAITNLEKTVYRNKIYITH